MIGGKGPRGTGYRVPGEWEPHQGCWLAWPCGEALWGHHLDDVRAAFLQFCDAIADHDPQTGQPRGEALHILTPAGEERRILRRALGRLPAQFHEIPYGDIWLRDTGPIFAVRPDGTVVALRFAFNGWGGKFLFAHDDAVAASIAAHCALPEFSFPWVLEGGSVEVDGEGTCITTRQCLLNPNRNPAMSPTAIESGLRKALGVERILWLDRGLCNDHTDGHVDTLARFVAPGVVVCMEAESADDPNAAVLDAVAGELARSIDARGRRLQVIRTPSPGRIADDEGRVVPASYVNFYIGNRTVVVPVYGSPQDRAAVHAIAACFPDRRTVGIAARALVACGGGAFHCITRQMPAAVRPRM